MDATTSKILSICILLVETCLCGLLPLCLLNSLRRAGASITRILELANLFAGGVFLATLLLHLMPEAVETLEHALEDSGIHIDYPLAEVLVASGFFLIAVTEQLAFCFHHTVPEDCAPSLQHSSNHGHFHTSNASDSAHQHIDETTRLLPKECQRSRAEETNDVTENSCSHNAPVMIADTHDHIETSVVTVTSSHRTLTIRSLLFFLALSLHSLFEGMAIGLQETVEDVLETLLAVAIHKGVIAFSFTLSMTQQAIRPLVIVFYVVALAVISPAGIAIGIGVSESNAGVAASLANGVLQSVAAGTFLFVVFFEILPRELHCHQRLDGALNLMFTTLGFGLMAGLQAIGSHDHEHGHGPE